MNTFLKYFFAFTFGVVMGLIAGWVAFFITGNFDVARGAVFAVSCITAFAASRVFN